MAETDSQKMAGVDEIERAPQLAERPQEHTTYDHDDIHQAALADNPLKAERPSWSTILSIVFVGSSIVAPVACGFIVATSVLFPIGKDLGDLENLGWVVSGWSIASSVSFSLAGSLSDIFGRRDVILAGGAISLVGAIIASVAKNMSTLIVGSTLLGLSCGFALTSYAAIPELLPNKYRALGLSCVEGFLTVPWVALATLLGNLFVVHATWRWVYYICIIYAALGLVGTAIFYFPPPRPRPSDASKTRLQEFLGLDYFGILLYAGGLTSILLGLSWGGTADHAWRSVSVIAPITLGTVGFVASFAYDFLIVEKTARHALFPRDLLRRFREFTISLVVTFTTGMVYYTMSAFVPQASQLVFGTTGIRLGVLLLPNGLGQMVGTWLMPTFVIWTGHPTRYLLAGVFLETLFVGLYAYGISGHKTAWAAFQFFGAGPFGLLTIMLILNAGLHVRPSELGIAVGLLGTFRSMGGSVGNALFGAILRNVANEELPKRIVAAAVAKGYEGDLSALIGAVIATGNGVPNAFASLEAVTPELQAATMQAFSQAYAQAFKMVFYSTIPFGVIAVVAALFIKDSTEYMTNHTHVHLVKDVLKTSDPEEKKTAG